MSPFDDETVSAITTYMNTNHAELLLQIVRSQSSRADAAAALLIDISGTAAIFNIGTIDKPLRIEVRWNRPITTRAQIREELFELAQAI